MSVKYSICMCNYNMDDTLERSLCSILDQLNERFEVLVLDDGSSDNSVAIIKGLQKRYSNLRLISLERDRKRKLGMTRNISVKEARGDYVLLHLDCDDIYDSYLIDFINVFHQIENSVKKDILLSGQHINMGKRSFLLKYGPYRNLYRGEDRDLWIRLASENAYIPMDHIDFVTRLPRSTKRRIWGSIYNTWDLLMTDFRSGRTVKEFLRAETGRGHEMTYKLRFFRLLILYPTYFFAKFCKPLPLPENMRTSENVLAYRYKTKGTFPEVMRRHGCEPDFSDMSENAQKIFK